MFASNIFLIFSATTRVNPKLCTGRTQTIQVNRFVWHGTLWCICGIPYYSQSMFVVKHTLLLLRDEGGSNFFLFRFPPNLGSLFQSDEAIS